MLSGLIALGVATAAKADTYTYGFAENTTIGSPMQVSGFFGTDKQGSLTAADITTWGITINSGSLVLNLSPDNSTLSISPNTSISATSGGLTFIAPTETDGFRLEGTADRSEGAYDITWAFASGGPTQLVLITPPNNGQMLDGAILYNSFPATFSADLLGVTPSPVPEPSSVLLLGTGTLSLAAGLRRRLMTRSQDVR